MKNKLVIASIFLSLFLFTPHVTFAVACSPVGSEFQWSYVFSVWESTSGGGENWIPPIGLYTSPGFVSGPVDYGEGIWQSSGPYPGIMGTGDYFTCLVSTAPPTPTNFTATPQACGTGQINLSWNSSSGATSYDIERDGVVTNVGNVTTNNHTGLAAGSSHVYRVRAVSGGGSSPWSGFVNATAPSSCAFPNLVPSLPSARPYTFPMLTATTVVQGDTLLLQTNAIQNQGSGLAGPHTDGGFYIDNNNDGNADYTAAIPRQTSTTTVGGSYTKEVMWTAPFNAPLNSNYRVSYIADVGNEINESNEGDNFSGWTSTFAVTGPPTLSLSGVVSDGSDNVSVTYSKNFHTCAHLLNSSNAILVSDLCSAGTNVVKTHAPGDLNLTPGQVVPGIQVKVCHGNNYAICSGYVTVGATGPDLVAASTTVSSGTVIAGNPITFGTGNITNNGTVAAGPYTVGGFYIDNNNDGNADYTQAAGNIAVSTAVGGSNSRNGIVWTVPAGAPPGTYRVSYIADTPATIAESNEGNNFSGWTSFTVTPPTPTSVSFTPLNVNCAIANGGKIDLLWNTVPAAQDYTIRVTDVTGGGTVTLVSTTSTRYVHENQTEGNVYGYEVRANANGVSSAWSSPQNHRACSPKTPINLAATPSVCPARAATLTWSAVPSDPFWTGYRIFRDGVLLQSGIGASSATTSYTDWNAPSGVRQYSIASGGKQNSLTSASVSVTIPTCALPDLVAASTTVSAGSVAQGGTITFGTGNIVNSGTAVAGTYTVGGFYIDNNNDGNADYTQAAGSVMFTTAVGASNSRNGIVWTVPVAAPPGTYRVSYIADVSNVVGELNENNNFSGWTSFTVTAGAPATPTNLTAAPQACGTGQINLSWNSSASATSYDIERDGVVTNVGNVTAQSHTGLVASSSHSYRVRAVNAGGTSAWSSVVNATAPVICAPPTPNNLTAAPQACGTGQINLSWNSSASATSYDIERDGVVTNVGNVTTNNHTGLAANSAHAYRVRAVNAGGSSVWSTTVNATAPASCTFPDLVAASTTVSAGSVVQGGTITFGTGNIMNSGSAVAGPYPVGGFYIDNNNDGTADFTQPAGNIAVNTPVGGSNSRNGIVWTVPAGAPPGTYRVSYIADTPATIAESNEGNNFSGWTSFTVTTAAPATPTGLIVSPQACGTGQINVAWNSSGGATGYKLYDNGVLIYSGGSTGYSHTGLTAASVHPYTVVATNAGGDSAPTAITSGTAPQVCAPATPAAPTAVAQACGTGQINVSWSSVSGATTYTLYDSGVSIYTGNALTFNHTGLTASTSHSYTLIASNAGGSSAASTPTTRVSPQVCAPAVPTGLNATTGSCGSNQISLAWNAVAGATSYTLYRNGTPIYTGGGASYADSGLSPNTSYPYTVLASNAGGNSALSSSINGTSPAVCPAPNLVSDSLTVTGTLKVGQTLAITAVAKNDGTAATGAFSHDVTYQWNGTGGAWTTVPGGIFAEPGGLGAGASASDMVNFPLSQSGTLYIQHCVDSYNQVNEGSAETPNCYVSSGYTVSPYASCAGGMQGGTCTVNATPHNGTSGSCGNGYSGTCQYTCNDGVWVQNSNMCVPPAISQFEVCTDLTGDCTSVGGTHTVATNTPLTITWQASADTCTAVTGQDFSTAPANAPSGSDSFNAPSAPGSSEQYQIGCQYGTGVPVTASLTVSTQQGTPILSASSRTVGEGDTVRLTWDTNNGNEQACTFTGGSIDGPLTLGNGTLDAETGYTDVTIMGRTTFILTCGGQADVKTIEIIPIGWEV